MIPAAYRIIRGRSRTSQSFLYLKCRSPRSLQRHPLRAVSRVGYAAATLLCCHEVLEQYTREHHWVQLALLLKMPILCPVEMKTKVQGSQVLRKIVLFVYALKMI